MELFVNCTDLSNRLEAHLQKEAFLLRFSSLSVLQFTNVPQLLSEPKSC